MKRMFFRITIFLLFVGVVCPVLRAQDEDGNGIDATFRQALFAEEVDLDLDAAREGYAEVLKQFTEQKKIAATATFRLAEVYRKLAISEPDGKHEDQAASRYEKVIREFPEMEALGKLSRENLVAMGRTVPEIEGTVLADDESKIIAELRKWKETSPDKLREKPTPLYGAAEANHLRAAGFLIAQGVDLNVGSNDTPLAIAANLGHLSMVKLLLEAGADPLMQTGHPPIHYALYGNRVEVVKALIEAGAHLGVHDAFGNPPLQTVIEMPEYKNAPHGAVLSDKQQLVYTRMLIDAGVDVNELDARSGETALIKAAREGLHGFVDLLLKEGADPNRTGEKLKETALISAAKKRDTALAQKLLEAGAEVNQADSKGYAPLHYAVIDGRTSPVLVQALIDAGADVDQRIGKDGWAALHFWANDPRDDQKGRALYRAGANPIALAKGFPPNSDIRAPGSLDVEKNTPLHVLMDRKRNDTPIVREFFEHGVQTLPPQDFTNGVWFMMPLGNIREPNPGIEKAPTDLIPNLYPIYQRGTENLPPPTLADFIIQAFDDPYGETRNSRPNIEKIRIIRPVEKAGGKQGWKTISVFYKELVEKAAPDSDPILQWGDVVLFDLETDRLNGDWKEFEEPVKLFLSRSSRVSFDLKLADLDYPVTLLPDSDHHSVDVAGEYHYSYDKTSVRHLKNIKQFASWREDLDFASVKVFREVDGQKREFDFNLEKEATEGGFFLQNGDRVVVPRKSGHVRPALKYPMNYIRVSRPGIHQIKIAAKKSDFEERGAETIPLARVLAQHYSDSESLPHPDFGKLRLLPPNAEPMEATLSKNADLPVPWGAIIEIPLKEGAKPETWTGLSEEDRKLLAELSSVSILIRPEGIEERSVETGFTFGNYERIATGELVTKNSGGRKTLPEPTFYDVLGEQFSGDDVKWDRKKVILKAGKEQWTLSAEKGIPNFFEGDILEIFRAL